MESKLQQLTEKLYNEGLSQGRIKAQELIDTATEQSKKMLEDAKNEAARIKEQAMLNAEELKKNAENELKLAASQMQSALRQRIEQMVVAKISDKKMSQAWTNGEFVSNLVIDAVRTWNPNSDNQIKLILPENINVQMRENIEAQMTDNFKDGFEIITDSKLKVPFRIAPKDKGYYVSFTDQDFENLFKSYIRPKVAEILYGGENVAK